MLVANARLSPYRGTFTGFRRMYDGRRTARRLHSDHADQHGHPAGTDSGWHRRTVLPVLPGAADDHVRRPRDVAAVRELCPRRPARRDGAVLSPARPRLPALPARAAAGVRGARGDLHRVRLLL